jgi:hypothetical protein
VCHVSRPSSYRSRRGHIHLLRVLPLVGCRSKTPTAAGRHVRPPTSPTTRAAAMLEKVHPQHRTVDATVGIKWPGPLPSKDDPRMARARGSKNPDPRGVRFTDQWPRSPFSINGRHRCPRSTKITDQRFEGRPGCEPSKIADVRSRGQPVATPQRPY